MPNRIAVCFAPDLSIDAPIHISGDYALTQLTGPVSFMVCVEKRSLAIDVGPLNGFHEGTDLSGWTCEQLDEVAQELNDRPRLCLGDQTPTDAMQRWTRQHQHV